MFQMLVYKNMYYSFFSSEKKKNYCEKVNFRLQNNHYILEKKFHL